MTNHQATRQLRKKAALLGFEIEQLGNQVRYVLGFVQFLEQNGVDVQEMEVKYRPWIEEQRKA